MLHHLTRRAAALAALAAAAAAIGMATGAHASCAPAQLLQCTTDYSSCSMGKTGLEICQCYGPYVNCLSMCNAPSIGSIRSSCTLICSAAQCGGSGGDTPMAPTGIMMPPSEGPSDTPTPGSVIVEPIPAPPPRTQGQIQGDLRISLYPALAIVGTIALAVLMCIGVRGGLAGGAHRALLVLGVLQLISCVFWLFHTAQLSMLQLFYSAFFTVFVAFHHAQLRLVQLLALVAIVNMLCMTGNMPLLGFTSVPYDSALSSQTSACMSRFALPPPPTPVPPTAPVPFVPVPPTASPPPTPPVPPTPPTQCYQYINVVAFFGLFITVLQPIIALFAFLAWSGDSAKPLYN